MINYIFAFFFIVGIGYGILNNVNISNVMIDSGSEAVKIVMNIIPVTCLWLGIMNIAKNSGLLDKLSKILYPVLRFLFPEIPKNSICFSYIATNIIMNMFGLGNAATPMGIKALKSMKELNDNSTTASDSMITFLVLNTTGFTLIPTTIIAYRLMYGSANPNAITPICIIASLLGSICGIIINLIIRRISKWHS